MASYYQNLETRRDAIAAELATLTAVSAGGKPNTTGPGEHVDHNSYINSLMQQLEQIKKLLAAKPFQIETQVII